MAVQTAVAAGGGARNAATAAVLGERVAGLLPAAALCMGGAAAGAGGAGRSCGWEWVEELRLGVGGGASNRE